ncbi:MAG: PHP domain-containing protein, partial [Clostridia bacterium]
STFSDGKYTPEQLKEKYKEHGYSILAYSDHNILLPHTELKDAAFLPITAIEIDCTERKEDWCTAKTYHLNYFSFDENKNKFVDVERTYSIENINDIIRRANENGFLAQYNHPRWSFQTAEDFIPLEGLWGFEVYNTGCQIEMLDGFADYEYECMARSGKLIATSATDDNHNPWMDDSSPYSDSFGGFTMIKAEKLEYGTIMNAMKSKNCYASTGPELNVLYFEDDVLHVECSPCSAIMASTDSRRTRIYRSLRDDMISMDIQMEFPFEWLRVECVDSYGRKAISRAYAKSEMGK